MKVAFCFLTYSGIEQINAWKLFFASIPITEYSIIVHRKDYILENQLDNSVTIPNIRTEWGDFSLVEAAQNMFNEGLKDPDNYYFVLLSGECIPLITFNDVKAKLHDKRGIIHYFAGNNLEREIGLNKTFLPSLQNYSWTKISQWVMLTRFYVDILKSNFLNIKKAFQNVKTPDEHVYSVFFNSINLLHHFSNEQVMYVEWNNDTAECIRHHKSIPKIFHKNELTVEFKNGLIEKGCMFLRKVCNVEQV